MEERFEYEKRDDGYYSIIDKSLNRYLNVVTNVDLLNEQDQKLKGLEEEIKQLKFDCAMYKSANYLINAYGIDKAREVLLQNEKTMIQKQNSKAIEVLSSLKAILVNKVSPVVFSYTDYVDKIFETINNQIKELGGGEK